MRDGHTDTLMLAHSHSADRGLPLVPQDRSAPQIPSGVGRPQVHLASSLRVLSPPREQRLLTCGPSSTSLALCPMPPLWTAELSVPWDIHLQCCIRSPPRLQDPETFRVVSGNF